MKKSYSQTLRAFIRRVTEMLFRRGISARAAIVEMLRRLRQRGIWPVKSEAQKTMENLSENESQKPEKSDTGNAMRGTLYLVREKVSSRGKSSCFALNNRVERATYGGERIGVLTHGGHVSDVTVEHRGGRVEREVLKTSPP